MWSTFIVQDEEGRPTVVGATGGAAGAGGLAGLMGARGGGSKRRTRTTSGSMSESQEGKIKLTFFVAVVGITLTVLGVGTEFWVELAPSKSFYNNKTCLAAHYGLWKGCMKVLWVSDIDPDRESCGPADLPGESNCTYFKFYTTGENTVMFQKTTEKSLNMAAALLAIFSLFMMVMGAVCIVMAISKGVQFFLKPAFVCFTLSGLLVFLSVVVFHQSVLSLLASDHSVPLHHQLSWSVTCLGFAGALLVLAGALFLVLALPYRPWERCLPHRSADS
ncbi:calcium channel, voltage-dependent, gamma subunit 6a [Chanos chanos]|uniref:Calcium channel, voltage-dependent, gamma subunit 6a n=1 Tax=Chanos chanos TaxID=29144 RepID=A0A6J2WLI7_CHACN|nr:voltage-dependent calcium channel gamma-6 subunit-like [Chanos chanos]